MYPALLLEDPLSPGRYGSHRVEEIPAGAAPVLDPDAPCYGASAWNHIDDAIPLLERSGPAALAEAYDIARKRGAAFFSTARNPESGREEAHLLAWNQHAVLDGIRRTILRGIDGNDGPFARRFDYATGKLVWGN